MESIEKKKHKIKGLLAKAGCGLLAFVAGLAATYFLVPVKTLTIDLGMPEIETNIEETYFNQFVSKVSPMISGEEMEETFGLKANFDNFTVEWPNNRIKIDGEIDASIRSLSDLNFSVDLDVNYNNKCIDLGIAYADETVYLATKNLKLKQSFMTTEDATSELDLFVDHFIDLFFNENNPDGLRIKLELGQIVGSLLGDLDLSSLTSGVSLKVSEEEDDIYAYSTLDVGMNEDTNLNLKLIINKEEISLERVELGNITIGNVKIAGALNCKTNPNIYVYGFDDENYTYKKRDGFISMLSYSSWVDDIFELLKTRTIGLDLTATLVDENVSYGTLDLTADLDASRFKPLDLVDLVIGPELFNKIDMQAEEEQVESDLNPILQTLNDFDFSVGLKLHNLKEIDNVLTRVDYSNLSLAYFKNSDDVNAGYLTLNEENENAVMKATIDVDTINYLISEIPDLVNSLSNSKVTKAENKEKEGLFSFVTSSEFITAIHEGRYDCILDLLEDIRSTENTIEITINLSSLGFGENAKVKLVLNALKVEGEPSKVINISLQNIMLGNLKLSGSINTRKYNSNIIENIDSSRATYDKLDFVNGTFNQVEQILTTKQTGIKLSGSVLDENDLGFKFDGWAQLDYGEKNGFGHIEFDEYKYSSTKMQTPHTVDISIDNFDGNKASNNMYFEYREDLRGRFTLKTFDDLIDVVMKLINTEDQRFTKFISPILEQIMGSILVQTIESKDYIELSKPSYLKSIKQINDGSALEIVVAKELLMDFLPNDLKIKINFKKDTKNNKCIDSLEIADLNALGKNINAKIELADFDQNRENPVDLTKNFLDFSDIAVLLAFGIDTVEINYYHVKLTADITLGGTGAWLKIPLEDVVLDFHLLLENDKLKVYGSMPSSPNPFLTLSSEFVFEPSTDETDLLGGTFYILRKDRPTTLQKLNILNSVKQKQDVYFVSDSEFFGDNLVSLLVQGLTGFSRDLADSLSASINGSSSTTTEVDPKYEDIFTDTGFNYTCDENANKYTWKTGISIEALTGKSIIGPVEATINGTKVGENNFLKSAHATVDIASILGISADIEIIDPNPELFDWPDEIEEKYQSVINYYDGDIHAIMNNLDGYVTKL